MLVSTEHLPSINKASSKNNVRDKNNVEQKEIEIEVEKSLISVSASVT